MSLLTIKLDDVYPINCGTTQRPVYRVLSLFEDSFLVSKHSYSATDKEIFNGWFMVSTNNFIQGRLKFFKSLLGPLLDSSVTDEMIRKTLDKDEAEKTIFPFREDKFEKIMLHEIGAIKIKGGFLSARKKIFLNLGNKMVLKDFYFSVCAFTLWGMKDIPRETVRIFKVLQKSCIIRNLEISV